MAHKGSDTMRDILLSILEALEEIAPPAEENAEVQEEILEVQEKIPVSKSTKRSVKK